MNQGTILTLPLVLLSLGRINEAQDVYVSNPDKTKLIEFTTTSPYCTVHSDKEKIATILKLNPYNVQILNDNSVRKIEKPCKTRKMYGFIYPGTLWCGQGTKATNFTQLGVHKAEDSCCREHDNCPNFLLSGECKNGVCNNSAFTRSHCDCDSKFQECLRSTGTETANTIGAIFFNVAKIICFKEKDCSETNCPYEFLTSSRYEAGTSFFTLKHKKAFFLNIFLKKLHILK